MGFGNVNRYYDYEKLWVCVSGERRYWWIEGDNGMEDETWAFEGSESFQVSHDWRQKFHSSIV